MTFTSPLFSFSGLLVLVSILVVEGGGGVTVVVRLVPYVDTDIPSALQKEELLRCKSETTVFTLTYTHDKKFGIVDDNHTHARTHTTYTHKQLEESNESG